ncbi:MAG: PEGA domain-containing protein [Alistipes sp.]|nr:PEGA domain-containing protein [Alistipes sp.]
MKRILAILLTVFLCATATAQMENSIVIDTKSLRAVQTDALTGVNIDPIGQDHSRQACARIKIKFDRMSKAQIEALEVKMRSNTDLTKQKVADYYDNVLILEMTAKPNTRFYFYSPEFGESNEVTLNLEGNREYEMLASLNQTFSIVVSSNAENVDIYLDDVFKGKTDSSKSLTIKEIMIGAHTLKAVYGTVSSQQNIEVNSGSILFRQDVNTAANKPQYVVFTVEPKSSAVTIDGQLYVAEDGVVVALLQSGQHTYKAEARGYHSQSGTITVAGAKIERTITLKGDFATVTLTADSGADIYVNDKKVGTTSWSGKLNSGLYIFEARKSGYRTQSLTRQITSDPASQRYTLPALAPIYGSADITSSPAMADITLDGKAVGRTPLQLDNLLVGEHKITVSKSGYQPYSATVTVAEGKTATVNAALTKIATQTPNVTQQSVSNNKTSALYKVGDYYNDGVKEGVVFEVSADGRSGKIVSMKQSAEKLLWAPDSAEQKRLIGADSETNGAVNMAKVKTISGWRSKYPAFKWCADLGEGWYLPSKEELLTIYKNKDKLNPHLTDRISGFYWSSTENDEQYSGYFYAWLVFVGNGDTFSNSKYNDHYVRAVATFGNSSKSVSVGTVASNATTSAPYKVGDYYNENGKQGVVFEVSADGKHGKIVSMKQSSKGLQWSSDETAQKRLIGADSETDGAYNSAKVKAISGWQSKYPAFKWCADLGKGWYLPSKEELITIYKNKDKLNPNLTDKLSEFYWHWSSTECNTQLSSGAFCAWYVRMYDGFTIIDFKPNFNYVRAVSAF